MSMEKPPKVYTKPKKAPTPSRTRLSIRRDRINPADYTAYNLPWACEDCSHFIHNQQICTLGYQTELHRQEMMKKSYEISGTVSLCRFIEID